MSISSQARSQIITTVVGMFQSSPGSQYLTEFSDYLALPGTTLASLAKELGNTQGFQSIYAPTLSNQDFATQFANNLLGNLVADNNKSWAVNWLVGQLDNNQSRGEVAYNLINGLNNVADDNAAWGEAKKALVNKSTVAAWHAVHKAESSTSLETLQEVTKPVTNDIATVPQAAQDFKKEEFEASIKGTDASETITGTDGKDSIHGFAGDDIINSGKGDDWINPGEGNDRINPVDQSDLTYEGFSSAITANMVTGVTTALNKSDTFVNIKRITGTEFDDTITGGNTINDGWEAFDGAAGNDTMHGGSGYDELMYHLDKGPQGVDVNFATGKANDAFGDTDTFTGMEAVRGTRLDDTFTGSNDIEFISYRGLAGNDTINGGVYNETTKLGWDRADYSRDDNYKNKEGKLGDAGISADLAAGTIIDGFGDTDTVSNIDQVRGTRYNDTLKGDDKRNTLEGRDGNDILTGLAGDDKLVGGNGNDTFVFTPSWGVDTVSDFVTGEDKLDMKATALSFAQLTITQTGSDTLITSGTDSITLTGVSSVIESDFIFS